MPSDFKITLVMARNLPVMDHTFQTTNAHCIVKFGRGQGDQSTNADIQSTSV